MSKTKKLPSRKKTALELLHQRLGHRSNRSLLTGETDNVWEYKKLRIYPDPFCTSCQISSMNKKARSKFHSSQRHPSREFLWILFHHQHPNFFTSETIFSSYLLTFDSYSKIPKLYDMEKITTE